MYRIETTYSKSLALYEEPGYRIWRNRYRVVKVQLYETYTFATILPDGTYINESSTYWETLTELHDYRSRYFGNRSRKLQVNKDYVEMGRLWIAKYKQLLANGLLTVKCDNWDGLGTQCPNQYVMKDSDRIGCSISKWVLAGYVGSYPANRELPGVCDGPINGDMWTGYASMIVPTSLDKDGFGMHHLARLRYKIWKQSLVET